VKRILRSTLGLKNEDSETQFTTKIDIFLLLFFSFFLIVLQSIIVVAAAAACVCVCVCVYITVVNDSFWNLVHFMLSSSILYTSYLVKFHYFAKQQTVCVQRLNEVDWDERRAQKSVIFHLSLLNSGSVKFILGELDLVSGWDILQWVEAT